MMSTSFSHAAERPAAQRGAQGDLGALLLNPPSGSGARTWRQLETAAGIIGCTSIRVANLVDFRTKTLNELSSATASQDWLRARPEIESLIESCDHILVGWGLHLPSGPAGPLMRAQVDWALGALVRHPIPSVWTVGGESRHPSRWHQYIAAKHGRARGTTSKERLASVLARTSVQALRTVPHGSANVLSSQAPARRVDSISSA